MKIVLCAYHRRQTIQQPVKRHFDGKQSSLVSLDTTQIRARWKAEDEKPASHHYLSPVWFWGHSRSDIVISFMSIWCETKSECKGARGSGLPRWICMLHCGQLRDRKPIRPDQSLLTILGNKRNSNITRQKFVHSNMQHFPHIKFSEYRKLLTTIRTVNERFVQQFIIRKKIFVL